jgi:hypothetical protein
MYYFKEQFVDYNGEWSESVQMFYLKHLEGF